MYLLPFGQVLFGQKVLFVKLAIGQDLLFADSAISRLGFWARRVIRRLSYWVSSVIRRVDYWVNSDNSTKIRRKEHSTKTVSPRRDYTNTGVSRNNTDLDVQN